MYVMFFCLFFSYPKEIKKDQKVDNVFSCIFSSILLFNSQQSSRDHVVYFFFSTLDFFLIQGKCQSVPIL